MEETFRRAWIAWDLSGGKRIAEIEEWSLDLESGKYSLRRITIDPLEEARLESTRIPREIEELLEPPVFEVGGRSIPALIGLPPVESKGGTGELNNDLDIPGLGESTRTSTRGKQRQRGEENTSTTTTGGSGGNPPVIPALSPLSPRHRRRRRIHGPGASRRSRRIVYSEIVYPEPLLPF